MEDHEVMVEEVAEELSFPVPRTQDIGWLLIGGGAVGVLITLLRGERSLGDWVIPAGLVGFGSAILLKRRQGHIHEAEASITAELDALDPIARAQVLRAVTKEQLGRLPGFGSSDSDA